MWVNNAEDVLVFQQARHIVRPLHHPTKAITLFSKPRKKIWVSERQSSVEHV